MESENRKTDLLCRSCCLGSCWPEGPRGTAGAIRATCLLAPRRGRKPGGLGAVPGGGFWAICSSTASAWPPAPA